MNKCGSKGVTSTEQENEAGGGGRPDSMGTGRESDRPFPCASMRCRERMLQQRVQTPCEASLYHQKSKDDKNIAP
jgi:hypothetical protein